MCCFSSIHGKLNAITYNNRDKYTKETTIIACLLWTMQLISQLHTPIPTAMDLSVAGLFIRKLRLDQIHGTVAS